MIKHEAGEMVQSEANAEDKRTAVEHPQVAITADCGLSTSAARKRRSGCKDRAASQEQGLPAAFPWFAVYDAALRQCWALLVRCHC